VAELSCDEPQGVSRRRASLAARAALRDAQRHGLKDPREEIGRRLVLVQRQDLRDVPVRADDDPAPCLAVDAARGSPGR
jgi:hypothetical protein